jgi:hypothetical protein
MLLSPCLCFEVSFFDFEIPKFTCVFVLVFLVNISNFLILGLDSCGFASELHLLPCVV